jgi:hypothetical protein
MPLANHTVQLRNTATGVIVQTVTSDPKGSFSFTNIYGPATYVIEIIGPEGVIGVSPKIETGKDCRPIGGLVITTSAGVAATGGIAAATIIAATAGGVAGFFVVKDLSSGSK